MSDDGELQRLVDEVLAAESDLVERYRAGNAGLLNALLGAAMRASGGRANPKAVRTRLQQALGAPSS